MKNETATAWRNRMVLLLDHLPMPVAICDDDGRILLANPQMAAEWDTLPGRMHGRNTLEFFRPHDHRQLHPIVEALRLRHRSRYPVEVQWTGPGGTERHGKLTVDVVSESPGADTVLLLLLNVLGEVTDEPAAAAPANALEAQILALAAGGSTTAQIGRAVGLTTDGVNYHLQRVSRRWRVGNRTALVARAYVLGVLDPSAWPPEPA